MLNRLQYSVPGANLLSAWDVIPSGVSSIVSVKLAETPLAVHHYLPRLLPQWHNYRNPPAHACRGLIRCLTIPWLFHEWMLPHLATLIVYIYHLPDPVPLWSVPDPDSEPLWSMPDPDRVPLWSKPKRCRYIDVDSKILVGTAIPTAITSSTVHGFYILILLGLGQDISSQQSKVRWKTVVR